MMSEPFLYDGLFECEICNDIRRYDPATGDLIAACACCGPCEGSGRKDGHRRHTACPACNGTGRRLPGSEEVTAVERMGPRRAPPE